MLSDFLKKNIKSQASVDGDPNGYVEYGYGQVEPNHLSAQRTSQIYAQLPAAPAIDILENGQFVKYNYKDGVCDFGGPDGGIDNHAGGVGEWMLVFNEIKLYRDGQMDCEFAMKKDNYFARIYSPVSGDTNFDAQSRFYGTNQGQPTWQTMVQNAAKAANVDSSVVNTTKENVVVPDGDMYELHYNNEPFHIESQTTPMPMPKGTQMTPRVFKTNVGDIMTTNMIKEKSLELGDLLTPQAENGILAKASASQDGHAGHMVWQVVKLYTLPDHQKAAKIMRVQ